ncbi:MAG: hypothetical protein WCK84_07985 [Bacteroidota bacterium]
MDITAIDLYNILRSKIGDKEAKSLIEFVETSLDEKLEERKDFLASKSDLHSVKADMIKWMFIFWVGQISVNIALMVLFIK